MEVLWSGQSLPPPSRKPDAMLRRGGEPPQMVIFGVTTAYMIGAAIFCVYKAVELSADSLIMAQIVISLVSTCALLPASKRALPRLELSGNPSADGCYLLSSLIALDPWVCGSYASREQASQTTDQLDRTAHGDQHPPIPAARAFLHQPPLLLRVLQLARPELGNEGADQVGDRSRDYAQDQQQRGGHGSSGRPVGHWCAVFSGLQSCDVSAF